MKRIITAVLLFLSSYTAASEWVDSVDIEKLFTAAGLEGTFVLYDVAEDKLIGFNQQRAETRFIPASTFKIPHTMIGLAEGAVSNVDEVLPYGGGEQPYDFWERDMSLRDAIVISNVPVYQGLARRLTLERMAENVSLLGYGNADIGTVVDRFWLAGPLTISAVEQAHFLSTLAQNKLPYSDDIQQQVRDITLLDHGDDWALHGKSGLTDTPDPDLGWWVGWVVKQGKVYSFALNVDILDPVDVDKRVGLGQEILTVLGIL